MAKETLSNLFISGFSKRITLQAVKELDIEIKHQIQNNDEKCASTVYLTAFLMLDYKTRIITSYLLNSIFLPIHVLMLLKWLIIKNRGNSSRLAQNQMQFLIENNKDQEINTDNDSPWFSKTIAIYGDQQGSKIEKLHLN